MIYVPVNVNDLPQYEFNFPGVRVLLEPPLSTNDLSDLGHWALYRMTVEYDNGVATRRKVLLHRSMTRRQIRRQIEHQVINKRFMEAMQENPNGASTGLEEVGQDDLPDTTGDTDVQ